MRDKLLPHALEMIDYQKPQWKNRVEYFMETRLNVRRWCPLFIWSPFYGDRGEDNLAYFQMLGPDASATVPELVRIMNHAEATRIRERAMYALSCIGKEGLRPLMEVAGDPQNPDRRRAAYAILGMKDLGPILGPAVPLLVKSLDDPDRNVSTAGAMILGELAIEPDISVPALTSCLRNTDEYLRQEAAEALAKFGGKARSAVPTLVSTLDDSDFNVRDAATNALLTISPESLPKAGAEN
jgi:HEAT repeat protein